MGRREARATAMTLLYSIQFHKDDPYSQIEYFKDDAKNNDLMFDEDKKDISSLAEKDIEYIDDVVLGVINNTEQIDNLISKYSKSWAFNRIPRADVAVLQLCIYEMLYRDDIPNNVSINEAVELAKKYGHEDSSSFVNGILGSIYRELEMKNSEECETKDNNDVNDEKVLSGCDEDNNN